MRDVKDAYRQAMVEEYEAYVRAGRTADAEYVAGVLSKFYGVDVASKKADAKKAEDTKSDDTLERTEKERPPEDTAKPPAKRGPGRPRKPSQGAQG